VLPHPKKVKQLTHKSWINFAVSLTIVLIILNVIITLNNNRIMEENRLLQRQAEEIKVTVSQFAIIIIHNLDLGIRGYALFNHDKFLYPMHFALRDKDSLFLSVGNLLEQQGYPLDEFYQLQDSTDAYADLCVQMKKLIDDGNMDEFKRLSNQDKGYKLWLQYEKVSTKINRFEDDINSQAFTKYHTALRNNYLVQIFLFLTCVPTLLFTAFQTHKKFAIQVKLRESEAEKAVILSRQNEILERQVAERTREIQAQNRMLQSKQEEITAQNEELKAQQEEISKQKDLLESQNKKLSEAQQTILMQNKKIIAKNDSLEEEIRDRTKELIEYNQQLQQFAFIAAHNLRAPAARILGLGKVLDYASDTNEEKLIIDKLISSTHELDTVIKDLNVILEIKGNGTSFLTPVNLNEELALVMSNLEREIQGTHADIRVNFENAPVIVCVKPYIDSILFNLVSNAIKYRHPDHKLVIEVKSYPINEYICISVSDNGLGFNTETHKQNLFTLYKRFHFHVEGKGMGLYLVKTQVVAMGGKIEVESKINQGTTFRIYLRKRPPENFTMRTA
jgi:signal transduction histidine kinase